jgi:CHAD domain-containing protein
MKARGIEGLDPDASLAENARLIVRARVDELYALAPAALDVSQVTALHDMRIAAKRLRYLLEIVGFCFGPYAETARRQARELHSLIGEIHDLDVLVPWLEQLEQSDGMRSLIARQRGKRAELFARFVERWSQISAEGLREQLLAALDEPGGAGSRPAPTLSA